MFGAWSLKGVKAMDKTEKMLELAIEVIATHKLCEDRDCEHFNDIANRPLDECSECWYAYLESKVSP